MTHAKMSVTAMDLSGNATVLIPAATGANQAAQVTAYDAVTGQLAVGGHEVGDTGWRNVAADIETGFSVTSMGLKRTANVVEMYFLVLATTGTSGTIYTLPTGFRPDAPTNLTRLVWHTGTSPAVMYRGQIGAVGAVDWAGASGVTVYGSCMWTTGDTWPASLPGV